MNLFFYTVLCEPALFAAACEWDDLNLTIVLRVTGLPITGPVEEPYANVIDCLRKQEYLCWVLEYFQI